MSLPFQIDKSDTQPYIFLMTFFRTHALQYKFYELIKYHLWGHVDAQKIYHNIFYLHDGDFLYFLLDMENVSNYRFMFYETLEELEAKLSSSLQIRFRKETRVE
ncbi:MAG: hypothetical protein EBU82_10985 [Flavobacteriia bacterium]|nr:hypothetical protein [Flavobacteriia bacterium]